MVLMYNYSYTEFALLIACHEPPMMSKYLFHKINTTEDRCCSNIYELAMYSWLHFISLYMFFHCLEHDKC